MKLDIYRARPREEGVVIVSASNGRAYTWIQRHALGGFTVGSATPFACPVAAWKWASQTVRRVAQIREREAMEAEGRAMVRQAAEGRALAEALARRDMNV